MDIIKTLLNLVFALIIVFGLMIITFKFMNKGIKKTTNNKYVKIIEKTQISKDSFIIVLRTGDEGMMILTSPGHIEKLKNLTKDEIENLEINKEQSIKEIDKFYEDILNVSKNKIQLAINKIKSKDDKHEKK